MTARTLPCQERWADFEITGGEKAHTDGLVVRQALAAAATCRALCPVRDACAALTATRPPIHRCVQGGLIWEPVGSYGSTSYTPAEWAKKHHVEPVVSKLPADAPHCAQCDTPFQAPQGRRLLLAAVHEPGTQPAGGRGPADRSGGDGGMTTTTKADPLAICEFCGGPTAGPLDVCTQPECLAKDIAREAEFKRLEDV